MSAPQPPKHSKAHVQDNYAAPLAVHVGATTPSTRASCKHMPHAHVGMHHKPICMHHKYLAATVQPTLSGPATSTHCAHHDLMMHQHLQEYSACCYNPPLSNLTSNQKLQTSLSLVPLKTLVQLRKGKLLLFGRWQSWPSTLTHNCSRSKPRKLPSGT